MSLESFTERIKTIVNTHDVPASKVKFDTDKGAVFVDATTKPAVITNEDKDADCVIKMSLEDAHKLLDGNLNVMSAVMFGKIKIKGDMSIAMKIAQVVGK